MTTIFQRKIRRTSTTADRSNGDNTIIDLTGIGTGGSSSSSSSSSYSPYLCNFCDVPLIKKMDDIKLLGTQDAGTAVNTRFICPKCGNICDPLRLGDLDNIKHAERGQTIRSNNSVGNEGRPFAEMFNSNTSTDDKGSLRKGTQLSKALSQTDIINNDDLEPNEDYILRGQNMRILKTETTYPESGRKVVKTFD